MIDKNIPAWKLSASQYCIQQDVKQPYICEISPMQMGLMGRRQLERYMKGRSAEWQAAANCKEEWRRKVYAAFKAGEFQKGAPSLHLEAWSAVVSSQIAEGKADRALAWRKYEQANRITSPADVSVGDRVFDVLCHRYARVLKLFPKGIRVQPETPSYQGDAMKPITRPAKMFDRMSYNDAKSAFDAMYDDV